MANDGMASGNAGNFAGALGDEREHFVVGVRR
jgi:hypothetical protein